MSGSWKRASLLLLAPVFACAHQPLAPKDAEAIEKVAYLPFTTTEQPEVTVSPGAQVNNGIAALIFFATINARERKAEELAAPLLAMLDGYDYEGEIHQAFEAQLGASKLDELQDPEGAVLLTRFDWRIEAGRLRVEADSVMYANATHWFEVSTGVDEKPPIYRRQMKFRWKKGEVEPAQLREVLEQTAEEVAAQVHEDLSAAL